MTLTTHWNKFSILGLFILCLVFPVSIAFTNLVWLLMLVFWVIIFIKEKRSLTIFKDKINYSLYIFLLISLISIVFSINFTESVLEVRKLGQMLIIYLFWDNIKSKDDLEKIVKLLIFSGTVVALFGIFQYLINIDVTIIDEKKVFNIPKYLSWLSEYFINLLSLSERRIRATQSLPLTFAELMLLIFPFSIVYFLDFRKKIQDKPFLKKFYFFSPIIIFISIILTFTRGAWLGLFFMLIFLMIVYRKVLRKILYLSSLLILLLLLIPLTAKNKITIMDRIKSIVDIEYNIGRINMWKAGFSIIKDYPIIGIGPRCLPKVYSKYALKTARSKYEGHIHSNYMQILVDRGILGFLAFCGFLIVFLKYFFKKFIRGPDGFSKNLNLSIFLAIFGFVVSGITEYSFGDAEVIMLFWGILGIGLALNKNDLVPYIERNFNINYLYIKQKLYELGYAFYHGVQEGGLEYLLSVGILSLAFVFPISIVLTNMVWLSVLLIWLIKYFKKKSISKIFTENINYPLYAFFFISIISIILSIDVYESLLELKKIGQVFILYIIWDSMNDEKFILKFIKVLVFSATMIAVLGIIQYLFNISYPYSIPNSFADTPKFILKFMSLSFGRVKGTRSIPLTFAEVMLMVFPFSVMISLYFNKNKTKKFYYHLYRWAPIIIALSVVFTFARIVIITMVFLAIIIGLVNRTFSRRILVFSSAALGIYFLIFIISGIFGIGNRLSLVKRFSELYYFRTKSARIYMWEAGKKIIKDYPLLGVGPRCVPKVYPKYVSKNARSKHEGHLHSNFIHISAERGILGLITFCIFLGYFLIRFFRNLLKPLSHISRYMLFGVLLSFLGFILSGISEYSFGDSEVAMLLWGVLGIGLSIEKINKDKGVKI